MREVSASLHQLVSASLHQLSALVFVCMCQFVCICVYAIYCTSFVACIRAHSQGSAPYYSWKVNGQ
jgi:hypothetical protein